MKLLLALLLISTVAFAATDTYNAIPPINLYSAYTTVTPPATPTDVCTIIGSSTSKVIRVQKVRVSTGQNTAGTNSWYLVKRSTADASFGNYTPATMVAIDTSFVAPTASVQKWTANPSLGTTVGTITGASVASYAPATAAGSNTYTFDFTVPAGGRPVVLRSASESLALNFNGVALPAGLVVGCEFVWSEENKINAQGN